MHPLVLILTISCLSKKYYIMWRKLSLFFTFLIVSFLTFYVTKTFLKGKDVNEPVAIVPEKDTIVKPISDGNLDTIPSKLDSTVDDVTIVLSASKPVVNEEGLFSFNANVKGEVRGPYHFELWSAVRLIMKSSNGSFSNIPAGQYRLCLVDSDAGKNIVSPVSVNAVDNSNPNTQKKLISEEDFQNRMIDRNDRSLNGGKKSFVTKSFRVVVADDNSEDEFEVSDIQDVRDMIYTYGKWKSARVIELEYNPQGYVTLAKIAPIY